MARQLLRRLLPLIVVFAALTLTVPAATLAGAGSDTIIGASGPAELPGSGGSSTGGPTAWFEIAGWDNLNWNDPALQRAISDFKAGKNYDGASPSDSGAYEFYTAQDYVGSACGNKDQFFFGLTDAKSGCVLWQNTKCPFSAAATPYKNLLYPLTKQYIQSCETNISNWSELQAKYNINSEIHTLSYFGGTGNQGKTINRLIGWNVQVWREGDPTPIFQRRIGLGRNKDFDPAPATGYLDSVAWWLGGTGHTALYSNGAFSAGMLGQEDNQTNDNAPCESRFDSGYTWFYYPDAGPNGTGEWLPNKARPPQNAGDSPTSSPSEVTGKGGTSGSFPGRQFGSWGGCYWQGAERSNSDGLKLGEALWLKWNVPNNGSKIGSFSYTLQGTPGQFYAIQVTAVDNREQLMTPETAVSAASFWTVDNYFRVFEATKSGNTDCLPTNPYYPTCIPPVTHNTPTPVPPPTLNSQLQTESPMPTRSVSTQTVQTEPAENLSSEQALFPETVALQHFTPQMQFNGSTASTSDYTDRAYAIYDSMTSSEPTVPYPYPGPSHGPQLLDMAYLQQPAHLDPSQPASVASSNDFTITWLHPTLENPCPTDDHTFTTPWPASPTQCSDGNSVRDAWDDTLTGKTTYEAMWVGANSTNTLGWVSNQPLRCNDPVTVFGDGKDTPMNSCNSTFTLKSYSGPEYTTNAASTQYAQGYIQVKHSKDSQHPNDEGEVHVVLKGSAQSALSGRSVYTRPSSDNNDPRYDVAAPIDATHGNQPNSQTGNNELWYCKAGLPVGANIAHGSSALSGDSSVQDPSQTGDNGCRGYTVDWNWDSPGPGGTSSANVQDACSTANDTPPATAFHSPSIDFMTGGEQAQAAAWGLYSNYDGQHNPDGSSPMADVFQGNPTDWNTLLSETDGPSGRTVPTVPYTGLRPGAGSGYDHPGCAKTYGDGRYDSGKWSDTGSSDTKIVGYTTVKIPAKYGWVYDSCATVVKHMVTKTVTKTVPKIVTKIVIRKGKRVKEEVKEEVKEKVEERVWDGSWDCQGGWLWEQTKPASSRLDPVYKTYEIWSWGWSGPCYPSNDSEQTQTAEPTKTIAQQYYSASAGGYILPVHTQSDEQSLYDAAASEPHTVGGKAPELKNPITDMGSQTCGRRVSGHLQTGEWRFNSGPQTGFGTNQTGYRLPNNQYLISYQFSGANIGGLTWNLSASYDGYTGWNWYSKTMQNDPFTDPSNQAAVQVYGFRSTR